MTTSRNEDDVLTLLIHLGYLVYNGEQKSVSIPNGEVREEYVNAVAVSDWGSVSKALKDSAETLRAIWQEEKDLQILYFYQENNSQTNRHLLLN